MKKISTNARRGLALIALLTAGSLAAQAQNVGIGTTAPDVSAALDIVSGSKGVLLPRVASTSGVPTPATGLIVYQTGGTPGYYYNSGTPGAPVWQQFATATGAAVTASNGLTRTGSNIALGGTLTGATTIAQAGNNFSLTGGGNVGIGTATPSQRLDVTGGGLRVGANGPFTSVTALDQGVHLQWNRSGFEGETWLINHLGLGTANAGIRFAGITTANGTVPTEWARFLNNGYFGLGTTAPSTLLDLGSSYGLTPSDPVTKKLALYNDSGFNFYGLGVSASQLNIFASAGPTGAPVMVLNANGNVGIGLGNALPAVKLDVNGGVNIQGANTLEFGAGVAGKEVNAGKIGYQALNVGALDISGAGTTTANRRIRFYNEGGASFTGKVGLGTATPNNLLDLGDSYGLTPSDPVAKKLAVYQESGNNNFYGLGVSASQLNIFASAGPTGAPVMVLNANGNVGIGLGNAVPAFKLDVAGDINATGQVRASGVVLTSDARFKQQVRPLGGALAAVQALRGVRYTWNALGIKHGGQAGAEQVGVLAQELEKVLPELVSTGPDGYKAVNYAQLTPVLIEAIKEQQQQIDALKAQNAALQGRTAQADADHASLQTLQAQMARLLDETAPAGAQARK